MVPKKFKNYNNDRNMLNKPTTKLSPFIKFGCVSIREVYHTIINKLFRMIYYFKKLSSESRDRKFVTIPIQTAFESIFFR